MKDFLLIGWGVVASLGAGIFWWLWRVTKRDLRRMNDLRDQALAETWNVRGESASTFRDMAERIWKLEDANAELRLGPRTATTRNQP
jgi:hypothetical protein